MADKRYREDDPDLMVDPDDDWDEDWEPAGRNGRGRDRDETGRKTGSTGAERIRNRRKANEAAARDERYAGRSSERGQRSAERTGRNAGPGDRSGSRSRVDAGTQRGTRGQTGSRNTASGNRANTGRNGRKRKRRRRNPIIPVVLLIVVILIGVMGYRIYQQRYGYSTEQADLNAYFGITDASDTAIVENNEILATKAKLYDGEVYLDLETVQENLNPRFYWGVTDNIVIYCEPTEMVTTTVGTNEWSSDTDGTVSESYVPAKLSDDGTTLYLALDYIKKFTNLSYASYSEPNRMVLSVSWGDRTVATLKKKSSVRVSGGVKSEILTTLEKGTEVTVLEPMEEWSRVETEDGFIGYLENKVLTDETTVTDTPVTDVAEPEFTTVRLDGTVNMAWHNVTNVDASAMIGEATADVQALNVIAPTWFPVTDDDGDLDSYATQSYVDTAHANGWKVWPVVDNFNIEGVDHNNCIALLSRRTNIINQLMTYADQYGFDGINVDFEQLDAAYGQDFIEFVRELSIACRKKGLSLSVDNYVTYNFNDYYHMDEQGVFADYVVIMGYDEHYAGSEEAGSVASIDYVKYGIERALQEVPAEKVVNGIPFYTRLWTSDDTGMTSQTLDMKTAQEFLANHGVTAQWDEATQQNVVDFTEGTTHYQMWLEDAESIRSKLGVMKADGIAGVAEWKLTQETADVWDVIAAYVNGTLN